MRQSGAFNESFIYLFIHFYVYGCFACLYVCALCAYLVSLKKKASEPLGLELQTAVHYPVGAENQIWVFWKSSQCFQWIRHLCSS